MPKKKSPRKKSKTHSLNTRNYWNAVSLLSQAQEMTVKVVRKKLSISRKKDSKAYRQMISNINTSPDIAADILLPYEKEYNVKVLETV